MWSKKSDKSDWPDSLIKSLMSADYLPNIRLLLILRCTLPATSAEAERSFPVLRLITKLSEESNDRYQVFGVNTDENTLHHQH